MFERRRRARGARQSLFDRRLSGCRGVAMAFADDVQTATGVLSAVSITCSVSRERRVHGKRDAPAPPPPSLAAHCAVLLLMCVRARLFADRFPLLVHCIAPLCACDVVFSCCLLAFVWGRFLPGGGALTEPGAPCTALAALYARARD